MGTSNINSKKYWHPSRYEIRQKVKDAEKKELKESLAKEILNEVKDDRKVRMEWMLPEYNIIDHDFLDKKFTK